MPELVEDVKAAVADEELHDIILISNSDNGIEEVSANRTILAMRSKVFRKMLFGGTFSESSQNKIQLDFPADILRSLVHFCFTDEVQEMHIMNIKGEVNEEEEICAMVELFNAADFFGISELQFKLESQIVDVLKGVSMQSVIFVACNIVDHEGRGLEMFNLAQTYLSDECYCLTPEELQDVSVRDIGKIFNAKTTESYQVECYDLLEGWAKQSGAHREAALRVLESIPFKNLGVEVFGAMLDGSLEQGGLITLEFAALVFREQATMLQLELGESKKREQAIHWISRS